MAAREMPLVRRRFRSMGTMISVTAAADAGAAEFDEVCRRTLATFRSYEARFSRFLPTSELSKVNAAAGAWTTVSPEFGAMVRFALDGSQRTGGLFDPTVLPALVAAGYDRDFGELGTVPLEILQPATPCGRWRDIEIEDERIRMPEGVGLDLGGIAKGWTVDVCADLGAETLPWVLVEAGGDLRIGGSVDPPGLDVAVEDPLDPGDEALRLRLTDGALATSSVTRRTWGPDLHHLIDPRIGRPSSTGVLQATAWAHTCREAEILSTHALLLGRPALDAVPSVLVFEGGTVITNLGLRAASSAG